MTPDTEKPKQEVEFDELMRLPLAVVLDIVKMKIEYSEDEYCFHSSVTGKKIFTESKTEFQTPFDVLRSRGYFKRPSFLKKAEEKYKKRFSGLPLT